MSECHHGLSQGPMVPWGWMVSPVKSDKWLPSPVGFCFSEHQPLCCFHQQELGILKFKFCRKGKEQKIQNAENVIGHSRKPFW